MFRWYKKYLERRANEKSQLADRQLDALRFRYHAFKNLLLTNNDLLEQMTRLESYLQDNRKVFPGLATKIDRLLKLAMDLTQNLNYVAEGAYTPLFAILRNMSSRLATLAREIDPGDKIPLIFPLEEAHTDLIDIVGGKAGPLGALKRRLDIPVPDGFVITTEGCRFFLEKNRLLQPIRELLRNVTSGDYREVEKVSRKIHEMVINAKIPEELRNVMAAAFDDLTMSSESPHTKGVAVRSSSIPEDGRYSFAGQFATILNVISKEAFFRAYKEVVASNFNETGISYRLHRQMGFGETDMAVLCLAMVSPRSAGTLYTVDPNDLESERMVLCSIWGLGEYLVNGRLPSDIFHISRLALDRFELVQLAKKDMRLVCDPERGGTREEAVAAADSLRFSMSEEEIHALCEYGLKIEKYMGVPQDIEWAVSEDGNIVILQARELQVRKASQQASRKIPADSKLLMERGTTASKGQATGTVFLVQVEKELQNVTASSVLVARESFIGIAKIMNRLRGIILEKGNPLEHLACVAREYRIPMVVGAVNATKILTGGQIVTLDADEARVYEGEERLLGAVPSEISLEADREPKVRNPKLDEIRRLIFQLNLLDVRDPNFQLVSCKSIHDVVRFCHEQGIQSMFEMNDGEYSKNKFFVSRLDAPIPLMVDIINLGGGISVAGHPRRICIEDITSVPFLALWKGVTHEGIRWSGPPPRVNLGALGSVVSNTIFDASRSGRPLGSRSYVLLSRDYMNLNARLAYHFAMVDTLCSANAVANYINFRFKGGGTGLERRMLRVRFIARILESLGFYVNVKQDLLNAATRGLPANELEEKLDMVGRLLGCARLLDMAMDDEEAMEWFVDAFQQGNYSFEPDRKQGSQGNS